MTRQEFIDDIRKAINDPDKVRWPDPDLVQRTNNTRVEMWGLHPEAFFVSSIVTALPSDWSDAALTSDIDFDRSWVQAAKAHVVWQFLMDETDDRQNVASADRNLAVWTMKAQV